MSKTSKGSSLAWYIAAAIIIALIIVVSGLTYQFAQPNNSNSPSSGTSPTASVSPSAGNITIAVYAGEVGSSTYGFGNTSDNITSPGPTLTVKVGSTVTVEFTNAGTMSHNWALVMQKTSGNTDLAFNKAQIASAVNPVQPGGKASVTFVANKEGTYYYICQVDAHVTLGMWGFFIVTN
jgi:plastocyanin